jgi:DNA-binding CsgD family transcriptional regulator
MAIRLVFEPENGWKGTAKSEPLTMRESLVLGLAAQGYGNKEIAELLDIKYQTVKNTFHKLTRKLGAKNNVHALTLAMRAGFIKIQMIADEVDESLPAEEREKARLWQEMELRKVRKMSKEEFEAYMEKCNKEVLLMEESVEGIRQIEDEVGSAKGEARGKRKRKVNKGM